MANYCRAGIKSLRGTLLKPSLNAFTNGVLELGVLDDPGIARFSTVVLPLLVLLPGNELALKKIRSYLR